MAVVRKVQSKLASKQVEAPVKMREPVAEKAGFKDGIRKKYCQFCVSKTEPVYWDVATLRRYLSDRGRIYSRQRSGACAKHQRRVSREIKHARHLALLPFTVRA